MYGYIFYIVYMYRDEINNSINLCRHRPWTKSNLVKQQNQVGTAIEQHRQCGTVKENHIYGIVTCV